MAGGAFGATCLLARLRTQEPYSNYRLPDSLEEFEFTLKGLVRLEMMAQEKYKGWRRLFGSTTKAKDVSAWRSRVLPRAFAGARDTRAFLEGCPLAAWQPEGRCPLLSHVQNNDDQWQMLWQVHEVWLSDDRPFSALLSEFLSGDSEVLALEGLHHCLAPLGREET